MLSYLQTRANWVATSDCKQTEYWKWRKLQATRRVRLWKEQGQERWTFKIELLKDMLLHVCLEHSKGLKPTPLEVISISYVMERKRESRTWCRQLLFYIGISSIWSIYTQKGIGVPEQGCKKADALDSAYSIQWLPKTICYCRISPNLECFSYSNFSNLSWIWSSYKILLGF